MSGRERIWVCLPENRHILNIFKIDFDGGKFILIGYRFSLSDKSCEQTGSWTSQQLEMATKEPWTLIYNYVDGNQHEPMKLEGRGFVSIRFNGNTIEEGRGSWISLVDTTRPSERLYSKYIKLTDDTSAELVYSKYIKVTPEIRRQLIKNAF
jgi:hypothetical protein